MSFERVKTLEFLEKYHSERLNRIWNDHPEIKAAMRDESICNVLGQKWSSKLERRVVKISYRVFWEYRIIGTVDVYRITLA
jgi:hypothetical protein